MRINETPSVHLPVSRLIGRFETPGGGAMTRLAAGAERLWSAYITWLVERLAIAELRAMSDHDLNNLALPRSKIAGAGAFGSATKSERVTAPGSSTPLGPIHDSQTPANWRDSNANHQAADDSAN